VIVRVSQVATAVFVVASTGAAAWSGLVVVAVLVDLILFAVGCAAFLVAYLRAVARSRDEAVSLGGLFFLGEGAAPTPVARMLRVLVGIQIVVALGTAAVRPFSSLAFGILAPMFGLAMMALWAAVHGCFPRRETPSVG
jgi:hypothetical protein